ncbi:5'-methylthioadenosine/S-adenosylhomocysteine nucleosidase [Ancrocorticia populi]|uniref:adenosylhomocysteine nucleosidase n=1 Tax=Ancrocorticia populi TaxID=2175228 RepID=A0A2V1K7R7_9ACTO|nr:5'-methylthioadenosine/S-adenosylhomocysteine nucleosidase [Ancrocorticia populi]PWF26227.1 5'-methylthioadenosine/S-adenosylhomocysteine nucleosidase [Ancrocorticia populi]
MTRIRAIVIAAQDEEIQPVLEQLTALATKPAKLACPVAAAWVAASTSGNILVLRTGIGLVATSNALGWAMARFTPKLVISTGSAGGLAKDVEVGEVVIGTTYRYGTADATAFGYALGQVPGQPEYYTGATDLIDQCPPEIRRGLMLSGDSFVTAANVGSTRENFPEALTTDMETTAAAQVCHAWDVPFISIRCVSDLCGPAADQDYHIGLDYASAASAKAAIELLVYLAEPGPSGPSQRFSEESLIAALLLLFASVNNLKPTDATDLPANLREAVTEQYEAVRPDLIEASLGLIAAGRQAIAEDPTVTLTAKQYDTERANLARELGLTTGRGQLAWPPTSQTIIKRFNGYWNDALSKVGMRVQSGRKRGGLKFSDQDYVTALRTFATWSAKQGISPSYKAYQQWIKDTDRRGAVPSGAAIRQRFGSWRAAAQEAQI